MPLLEPSHQDSVNQREENICQYWNLLFRLASIRENVRAGGVFAGIKLGVSTFAVPDPFPYSPWKKAWEERSNYLERNKSFIGRLDNIPKKGPIISTNVLE